MRALFDENVCENERIGSHGRGGGTCQRAPLDPPMVLLKQTMMLVDYQSLLSLTSRAYVVLHYYLCFQASLKGVSNTTTGWIFGEFALVQVVACLLYGYLVGYLKLIVQVQKTYSFKNPWFV